MTTIPSAEVLQVKQRLTEIIFSNGMTIPEIILKYDKGQKVEMLLELVHDDGKHTLSTPVLPCFK